MIPIFKPICSTCAAAGALLDVENHPHDQKRRTEKKDRVAERDERSEEVGGQISTYVIADSSTAEKYLHHAEKLRYFPLKVYALQNTFFTARKRTNKHTPNAR